MCALVFLFCVPVSRRPAAISWRSLQHAACHRRGLSLLRGCIAPAPSSPPPPSHPSPPPPHLGTLLLPLPPYSPFPRWRGVQRTPPAPSLTCRHAWRVASRRGERPRCGAVCWPTCACGCVAAGAQVAWLDHIRQKGAADLVLDTLNKNGHTSSADALWAGGCMRASRAPAPPSLPLCQVFLGVRTPSRCLSFVSREPRRAVL